MGHIRTSGGGNQGHKCHRPTFIGRACSVYACQGPGQLDQLKVADWYQAPKPSSCGWSECMSGPGLRHRLRESCDLIWNRSELFVLGRGGRDGIRTSCKQRGDVPKDTPSS